MTGGSGLSCDHAAAGDPSLLSLFSVNVGVLPPRWAECAELAKRCRSLNDHNGALVASRMRRIQGVLEVITGKRSDPNVYGKQAQQAWITRGRMVAAEA